MSRYWYWLYQKYPDLLMERKLGGKTNEYQQTKGTLNVAALW